MSLRPEDMRKIGGSDIAALMGVDPYKTGLSVWTRIVHGVETPDNPAMARGRRLEPVVIDWYRDETGRRVLVQEANGCADSRFRASLDCVSRIDCRPDTDRVVEAKTVGARGASAWGEPGTAEIPDGYALQCQWYLGHALREGWVQEDVADVPVLLAGDFALFQVRYDAEVFGMAEEAAARFWRDHVETDKPPEVTPTPQDAALVSRIRRRPELPHMEWASLGDEGQIDVLAAVAAHKALKRAEARMSVASTSAMLRIAGSSGVTGLPRECGYSRIDWSERKGRTTVDWEAVARGMMAQEPHDAGLFEQLVQQHTKQSAPTRAWCPQKAEGT